MQRHVQALTCAACIVGAYLVSAAAPGRAAETGGCESFAWPVKTELAWLKSADVETIASGSVVEQPPLKALLVKLPPVAEVSYPVTPTGKPKGDASKQFGAVVTIQTIPAAGVYQVSLSGPGWIDLVQDGKALVSQSHSGKSDCDGMRKSVRFGLVAGPLTLELSGVPQNEIKLTIRKAD